MPALLQETPARAAIAAVIEAQLGALRTELSGTHGKLKRGQVHRLRVATRRLLAALALASAAGTTLPKSLPRVLEELLEELAPLRDVQVMTRGLKQLPQADVERAVLRRLRRSKRKQREHAAKYLARLEADTLGAELANVVGAVQGGAGRAPAAVAELALTGYLAQQQLSIDVQRARAREASPHELHRLRLALKSYRYSLEILAGQLPASTQRLLELSAALQDELGYAHDRQVLWELVANDAEVRDSARSRRLAEQLASASREAHARAAQLVEQAELSWPFATSPQPQLRHMKSAT